MTTDASRTTGPTADEISARFLTGESFGYIFPAALRAAALLGVADHLVDGPLPPTELATRTGADSRSLYRVLRLLATRGIFRENDDGTFCLTDLAQALRTDSPASVRTGVAAASTEILWRAAGELTTAVQTGKPAADTIFGMPLFEYFQQNPKAGAEFHDGIGRFSYLEAKAFAETYPFPDSGVLADLGGGQGGLLLEVLTRHPGLRGILFDRAEVIENHQLGRLGNKSRWETTVGDFFTAVPPGADFYSMQYILHDWSDTECIQILRNCRDTMAPGGKVLIIDSVITPGNEPDYGKALDVLMLAANPGRERTAAEFAELLAAAGLRLVRIIPKPGALSIVEAEAAE